MSERQYIGLMTGQRSGGYTQGMKKLLTLLTVMLALSGCTRDPDGADLLAPQREAMDRAEEVERVLQDAAERQRRLIDDSEI